MNISFKKVSNTLIVKVKGELDHHTANMFKEDVDKEYGKGFKNIIFDFKQLNFMDSSGIGVILGRYKKVKENKGNISIVNPNSQLLKVIELSGLLRVINYYDKIDDAINNF
ncbi:anti-sigma F factor antagonist [Aceticella autotrophica]|uniref:Anti-sigma F factor antagonist n=1 Tax=Aceticella autotrophica TaxID=2755338 RepID=A0A974Y435_9THEO|nr:anti-sigma F factor antagonist [Aceticella autotrophica]MDI6605370.1 anti-sigma F factor antagonist [Thermoanaerobacteraceae bacterium]QSZ26487.1 anti-sigma F factor antagonist [Aceticella autotrophica]